MYIYLRVFNYIWFYFYFYKFFLVFCQVCLVTFDSPLSLFYIFLLLNFLNLLILESEREKYQFVVPLSDAVIGCLLYGRGWSLQPWHIKTMLSLTELPSQAILFLSSISFNISYVVMLHSVLIVLFKVLGGLNHACFCWLLLMVVGYFMV